MKFYFIHFTSFLNLGSCRIKEEYTHWQKIYSPHQIIELMLRFFQKQVRKFNRLIPKMMGQSILAHYFSVWRGLKMLDLFDCVLNVKKEFERQLIWYLCNPILTSLISRSQIFNAYNEATRFGDPIWIEQRNHQRKGEIILCS